MKYQTKADSLLKFMLQRLAPIAAMVCCTLFFSAKAQGIRVKIGQQQSFPCKIDTVKGLIYYQGITSTHSEMTEGYYIAACGGYQIGNFYGYEKAPTFIPAYFIRNDEIINGKREINRYVKQKNSGYFTDKKFKRLPIESIYGLITVPRK